MILTSSLATICLLAPAPPAPLAVRGPFPLISSSLVLEKPNAKKLGAQLALDSPVKDRIAAAKKLADMGKKCAGAVPQMILALNDPEALVLKSVTSALQAVGKKAREPLQEVLVSGEYEGQPVAAGPTTKVLLGMGKKATSFVREHIDAMEMGPRKIEFFQGLGVDGLPYLAETFGAADGAFDAEMMRVIRTLAAEAPREPESIAKTLKKVKDVPLSMALEMAWLQTPDQTFMSQYTAWLESDAPMLIETGLWTIGLMGQEAVAQVGAVAKHLDHADPLVRTTALWALESLMKPGPGHALPEIPASFPGASIATADRLKKATEGDIAMLWNNPGKSLGYRGRIGTKARARWGLAPTWTRTMEPVPLGPDRAKIPADLLGTEDRLFEIASDGQGLEARLASDVLAALGNSEERSRDLWLQWIATDDVALIQSGLVGLRAIGRGVIMIEEQPEGGYEALVASHLNRPETMVAAAQLLTQIMTPTAWESVVKQMMAIEGRPPLEMLAAISRYDIEALRPYVPQMQDLYESGEYMFSALLIKFGAEAMSSFEKELSSKLADRRMVAIECLGHIGPAARSVLPRLRSMRNKNMVMQKVITDAIKRIQ